MKTLLILRHAKSDWNATYSTDHERPLNKRGVAAAEKMGAALSRFGAVPGFIVSSSAVRTIQTAKLARSAGGWDAPITVDSQLYGAGTRDVLTVIKTQPDVQTLMIVGHQPTCGHLIEHLIGARVTVKTATVASVTFHISQWADILTAKGTLDFLLHPRLLPSKLESAP